MYNIKSSQLGWIVAAALGGILIGGGFEPEGPKYGVVDIVQVMSKSAMGAAFTKNYDAMRSARQALFQLIEQHPVMSPEQANELKDRMLKTTPTPEDTAKIEEIKKAVLDSEAKYQAIQQKQNPTDDDRKQLAFYNNEVHQMEETGRLWVQEQSQALTNWADTQRQALGQAARGATQDVGKAQGYTIVFDLSAAPYGVNDLTQAVIKTMDAKK